MTARARHLLALVVTVLVVALSGQAAALAPVGSVLADFTAYDPDDRPVTLHSHACTDGCKRGQVLEIVY